MSRRIQAITAHCCIITHHKRSYTSSRISTARRRTASSPPKIPSLRSVAACTSSTYIKAQMVVSDDVNDDGAAAAAANVPSILSATDHHDTVSRVFMLKLKSITDDLKNGCVIGAMKAYVYRIEWQARGLPHAHMLLIRRFCDM